MTKEEKPRNPPKKRSRKKKLLVWLAVDMTVAAVVIGLLVHAPSSYRPSPIDPAAYEPGQVHPYLTRLSSDFYNGAQMQDPFDFVVDQDRLNQAIADWFEQANDVSLYCPVVVFEDGMAVFMATADVKGFEFIVTIAVEPRIDAQGMMSLHVSKVKVGSMALTPIARFIAGQMYEQRVAEGVVDAEQWRAKLAAGLLGAEAFDPVIKAEDKKVRVQAVSADRGKLVVRFAPTR